MLFLSTFPLLIFSCGSALLIQEILGIKCSQDFLFTIPAINIFFYVGLPYFET
jgi:hypothetical protein